jgi:hypothetical protein
LNLLSVQPKEDLRLLKTEFGGQYVDQLMITSIQLGELQNELGIAQLHQLSDL